MIVIDSTFGVGGENRFSHCYGMSSRSNNTIEKIGEITGYFVRNNRFNPVSSNNHQIRHAHARHQRFPISCALSCETPSNNPVLENRPEALIIPTGITVSTRFHQMTGKLTLRPVRYVPRMLPRPVFGIVRLDQSRVHGFADVRDAVAEKGRTGNSGRRSVQFTAPPPGTPYSLARRAA
jgi:hypothetical protein